MTNFVPRMAAGATITCMLIGGGCGPKVTTARPKGKFIEVNLVYALDGSGKCLISGTPPKSVRVNQKKYESLLLVIDNKCNEHKLLIKSVKTNGSLANVCFGSVGLNTVEALAANTRYHLLCPFGPQIPDPSTPNALEFTATESFVIDIESFIDIEEGPDKNPSPGRTPTPTPN